MLKWIQRHGAFIAFGIVILACMIGIGELSALNVRESNQAKQRIEDQQRAAAQFSAAAHAIVHSCQQSNIQAAKARKVQRQRVTNLIRSVGTETNPSITLRIAAFLYAQVELLYPTRDCSPATLGVALLLASPKGVVPTSNPASKQPRPSGGVTTPTTVKLRHRPPVHRPAHALVTTTTVCDRAGKSGHCKKK